MNEEKLHKRCLALNDRHRFWNMTGVDCDFIEADVNGNCLALIESKFGRIKYLDLNEDYGIKVLCNLRNDLPIFGIIYYPMDKDGYLVGAGHEDAMVHIQFFTFPVNDAARRLLRTGKRMTEIELVTLMGRLHRVSPDEVRKNKYLCTEWKKLGDGRDVIIPQITYRPYV